jgi:hypothetical protein
MTFLDYPTPCSDISNLTKFWADHVIYCVCKKLWGKRKTFHYSPEWLASSSILVTSSCHLLSRKSVSICFSLDERTF